MAFHTLRRKHWGVFIAAVLLLTRPIFALAVHELGPATFHNSSTLWIGIVVGLIATLLTLYHATKLGGTLASVLWLFGTGMFLVVLGFMSLVFDWLDETFQKYAHDILFILGYLLMMTGGIKLYQLSRIR